MSYFKILDARRFSFWQLEAIGDRLLREEDKRELEASSGDSAGETLRRSVFNYPGLPLVAYAPDYKIVAVFGYIRLNIVKGRVIWMVATPHIYKHIKPFLKVSKTIIDYWLSKYGMLSGYIDSRNATHAKWLGHMGFTFGRSIRLHDKVPFRHFYKEKANV
jgi:hypothetical protein